ncbi:MAG: SpoVR family protein [Desulfosarcina sp.]|nr:SpoVR family protein [Desulfobacterales bacterium]
MELIDQHTKGIMEGCKERALDAGLRFDNETLEYIVTNRDLLELSPKMMIPNLYDYWVHDVEVLKEKGKYELYPGNPYETVINTRPAISYYNDNNPDWLNVMIFYHVLAHIDLFQSNIFFRHTWDYDFNGQALSDKRVLARLRSEKGRWVDYIIEFARGIDNLVGFHASLARMDDGGRQAPPTKLDYYFDVFLQRKTPFKISHYIAEVERYNKCLKENCQNSEDAFFSEIEVRHPEFHARYQKYARAGPDRPLDPVEYIMKHSQFLNREENLWMKTVVQVVRQTSIFFQPQIRTKILHEGWASYWHEKMFMQDDRIRGHEVEYARVNAGVTALPRVGLNPYALGLRLFQHIEEMAEMVKRSIAYQRIRDARRRQRYDRQTGQGQAFIFDVRTHYCDFMFIHQFIDQEFVDRYRLFVAGKRLNRQRMTWEYYVQSRDAERYREMVVDTLYHPPHVTVDPDRNEDGRLYLIHHFEGKPLVREYIANTLLGVEYLWGRPVCLETREMVPVSPGEETQAVVGASGSLSESPRATAGKWQRVRYTMEKRQLTRAIIE